MKPLPPLPLSLLLVGLVGAVALTSCGAPGPAPASGPAGRSSGPSTPAEGIDGLLVAADGGLRVTDLNGELMPLAGPPAPIVDISAGTERLLALDNTQGAWLAAGRQGDPEWHRFEGPDGGGGQLFGTIAPDDSRAAFALGRLQGRTFRLEIWRADESARTDVAVDGGLDGAPVWLGPSTIAARTIQPNGHSSFTLVDLDSGRQATVGASGTAISSSADGRLVAVDDQASGDVYVGSRGDWQVTGFDGFARIAAAEGSGIERLALSPSGTRLAIVRRSDAGVTIEILLDLDGAWRSITTIALASERGVAVAWRN